MNGNHLATGVEPVLLAAKSAAQLHSASPKTRQCLECAAEIQEPVDFPDLSDSLMPGTIQESRAEPTVPASQFTLSELLGILTKTQIGIYNVLSCKPQRAVDIAEKCKEFCEPQTVRRYLVEMHKRGIIRQAPNRMYFR